jgi:hypothetical protein
MRLTMASRAEPMKEKGRLKEEMNRCETAPRAKPTVCIEALAFFH